MIAAILLIHLILELLPKTGLPIEGVLAGAVLGSLCSVIMVLPAQFSVRPHSTALFGLLTSGLDELGYVPLNSQTGAVVYRQNLPGFLRWHEGNVSIERSGDCLFVKGALAIVIKIRLSLLRRIAA
jgi:hypothetical protein